MSASRAIRPYAAAALAAGVLGLASSSPVSAAETVSKSYTTTGEHAFVVPPAVSSVRVTLVGGYGGPGSAGAPGGIPATDSATLAVSPGETLYAEVAGNGVSAEVTGAEGGRGGYGGGGNGGIIVFVFASAPGGGGGGGASDVRRCPAGASPGQCGEHSSLLSRLLVAGGGGGGGGNGREPSTTAGGNGGAADQSGDAGAHDDATDEGGSGGGRGTSAAAGGAGSPSGGCSQMSASGCATTGELGDGGAGGESLGGGGGGGGGGIYGGGGGGAGAFSEPVADTFANGGGGGGGGGASGVPTGAAGVSDFTLVPTAEGAQPSVTFSWIAPPPTVVTTAAAGLAATTATLNGTVNPNDWQPTACGFSLTPAPAGVSTFPCAQQLAIGEVPVPVSATATGLSPGTTYTVTLSAATAQGSSSGGPVTFTTPVAGPGTGPPPPLQAPVISSLSLSPSRFRRGRHAATIARADGKQGARHGKTRTSTTISFELSAAATVTLTFERALTGERSARGCVAESAPHFPHGRHRPRACTLYRPVPGSSVTRPVQQGLGRIHFEGVPDSGRPLVPGRYRLIAVASDAAGKTPAAARPSFTLLR